MSENIDIKTIIRLINAYKDIVDISTKYGEGLYDGAIDILNIIESEIDHSKSTDKH